MRALQDSRRMSERFLGWRFRCSGTGLVVSWVGFFCVFAGFWFGTVGVVQAQDASPRKSRDEAYEAKLIESLTAMDPEAARVFAEANAARDRQDLDAAAVGYEKVRERAPKFSAATRRLCTIRLDQGQGAEALELCRKALATEDIAENQATLALALLQRSSSHTPTERAYAEAGQLAKAAVSRRPDDPFIRMVQCEASLRSNDVQQLENCVATLTNIAPNDAGTHVYASIAKASKGQFRDALESLDHAHALGLADAPYENLRKNMEESMPWTDRYGPLALRGFIGWAVGLVVLLVLGAILSKLTLLNVSKVPKTEDGRAAGADRALRQVYRIVLWLTCAYYYVSLPVVALIVLALGGGIVYGFLALGRIPIKLLVIVAIFTVVSLWAVLKSIFARPRESEPGEALDLNTEPKLRDVLIEVAQRIGTRPVDKVYLTPGTEVAVFERGGVLRQLSGKTERCLILGAGVLDGFETRAFKAVLAHEYGHFHNEDTAGGGFALAVRKSVLTMAISLAQGGAAGWFNPAWLFVNWFHKIFLRISQGASRLQEVLADRWAAYAYGADAFTIGLKHVIAQSVRFDVHTQCAISEVIKEKRALANLYQYRIKGKVPEQEKIEQAVQEAITAEPSPYDSHPSPAERFALVDALPKRIIDISENDKTPVWELFVNRAAIEKKMTAQIRNNVAENHGIIIHAKKARSKNTAVEESSEEAEEPGAVT